MLLLIGDRPQEFHMPACDGHWVYFLLSHPDQLRWLFSTHSQSIKIFLLWGACFLSCLSLIFFSSKGELLIIQFSILKDFFSLIPSTCIPEILPLDKSRSYRIIFINFTHNLEEKLRVNGQVPINLIIVLD